MSDPAFPFDDTLRQAIQTRLTRFDRHAAIGTGLKQSAVAVVLTASADGAAFILTQRAASLRSHSRQYAFPGGRCDADETPVETALRELSEELGLVLPMSAVLGLLDDYEIRSGYVMTPVVLWAGEAPALKPNENEVSAVRRIPVANLVRPEAVEWIDGPEPGRPILRLHFGPGAIHAPTGAILYQFSEVALLDRGTRVTHIDQPSFAWR
jgi:8-oxo-dGTP pyrophosphatase MutT (NUDIX family)